MSDKLVKVSIVSLKQPCSACLITCNLLREMLDKIIKECEYIELEDIELDSPKDVHSVEGLEVESFPALLVNGEQITAGSLPIRGQLISIIESEAKNCE